MKNPSDRVEGEAIERKQLMYRDSIIAKKRHKHLSKASESTDIPNLTTLFSS